VKPKIAVILSGYGVVHRGAETMLDELLPRLADRFDLHVYSRSGRGPGGIRRAAVSRSVLEPLYLSSVTLRKGMDTLFVDPIHAEWTSHLLLSLPSLIRGRYQAIWHETGLWGGYILGALRRLTGVKLLDYAHSSHPGWELPFARRRPDLLVTANPELAQTIRRQVPGLRVEVVPQGVDCQHFRPDIEPWDLDVRRPVALMVGALSPEKRPDLAIGAAAMSGVSLVVAGSGPLASRVDHQAAELLGVDRYHRLEIERAQLPRLYNAADLVILSSPLESGALAALEALACGKPVVTAADPIRTEIIGDGGILVEDQTPEAYAGAISKALAAQWGDRPRQRALAYSVDRQAQRFASLLGELTRETSP